MAVVALSVSKMMRVSLLKTPIFLNRLFIVFDKTRDSFFRLSLHSWSGELHLSAVMTLCLVILTTHL